MTYQKYTYSFEINGKCVTFSFYSKTKPIKLMASYGEYLKPYEPKEELEYLGSYLSPKSS